MKIQPDMLCWCDNHFGPKALVRTIEPGQHWFVKGSCWRVELLQAAPVSYYQRHPETVVPGTAVWCRESQLTPIPPDEIEAMARDSVDGPVVA